MGVENQQQNKLAKKRVSIWWKGDGCMHGWMNDDGWHSLNPNQNNVLDGLKPGSFILKLLWHRWASSPKQNGHKKHVRSPLVRANRWASSPNQSGRKKHVSSPLVWANRWASSRNQSGPNKNVRSPLVWAINGPQAQTKVRLRNMRGPLWLGPIGPKQSGHKKHVPLPMIGWWPIRRAWFCTNSRNTLSSHCYRMSPPNCQIRSQFQHPKERLYLCHIGFPILTREENNVHSPICLLWWFHVLD